MIASVDDALTSTHKYLPNVRTYVQIKHFTKIRFFIFLNLERLLLRLCTGIVLTNGRAYVIYIQRMLNIFKKKKKKKSIFQILANFIINI